MLLLCGRRQQGGRYACRLVVGAARQEHRLQHVYMAVSLACSCLQLSCGQAQAHEARLLSHPSAEGLAAACT